MSFVVRSAIERDLEDLIGLASQFALLNLPPDPDILSEKIERSLKSFNGKAKKKQDGEYIFVIEDLEREKVVGSSLILAKHGSRESPHSYFQVRKEEKFSQDLGIGFIHQVLRLKQTIDGPTEIGGLLVDRAYRSMPAKLGKQISLMRFIYIGMFPERFEENLLCEFAPPLTREGRSEFWEALGRRFTGLPYQEADGISQRHKEFIKSLFPQEDIYLCLLDQRARQVLGQVGEATRPAQHMLEGLGFKYLSEVDPFDGGPHYGAKTQEISIIKEGAFTKVERSASGQFSKKALLGISRDGAFRGCLSAIEHHDKRIVVPDATLGLLKIKEGDEVYCSTLN